MEVLTEIVKVIVEKIVAYTITAVGRQIGYLIHYKKKVDNLKNEVVDLEYARADLQREVQAARNNVEEIRVEVLTWLKRVETVTKEAQEFFKEGDEAKLKCFNGRCLNLKACYQLGKRAHKIGLAVLEIKEKDPFRRTVGYRVPIQGGTTISIKGYEDFKSRKSTLNGIMRDLKDDSIRAIGVYGMGGVGKTMLVGKVATQAIKDKLFERIVTLYVSQTPNLKKIQEDIAKELELKFKDEDTDFQKAHLLRERLKKEKILLIIDDIWDELDLEDLGISFGDDHEGSKLLLTSRSEDALGKYTDLFPKIFQVKPLSDDEAEFLFVTIVGKYFVDTLDFQFTLVDVVKECAGLPIAITTVANALKRRKDPKIWKDALVQLKKANPTQIKGMQEKVYSSIKLSYDFLTKEAQSLFLFCSIFEEDKVIEIDLLLRYLVGLDFFEDVYKMEEVRNRVHTLVNSLKDSCLLEGYENGTFKMHDVIRDVAIYIADKEKKMLTIRSLEGPEKWEDSFGIALFNVDFKELPERFGCPQLKFIFLGSKKYFSQPIPNNVFEGMKELRVLVLIKARLPHTSSISCPDNLQSLVLHACELEDVAFIGELKNLRALTLSHSNIMHAIFSNERTHEIQVNHDIRTDIIDFTKLRSLYLQNLPNFMGFHPDVDSQLLFNEKVAFSNLEEIYIEGIDNLKMLWHNHQPVPNSFCKIKKLHVGSCKNLMNIFPPNMLRRLQNLEELKIEDCNSVEEVFDARGENVDEICDKGSTQLRHPNLNNLPKLKDEWTSDSKAILTFQNLRKVEVSKCGTLKSLFPISVAKHLEQLVSLSINGCELMEEIVALEEGLESTTMFVFPRITSLSLELLLGLKYFYSGRYTSEWPSLKELTIRKCDKVKIVVGEELRYSNTDGLIRFVPVPQSLFRLEKDKFPNLKELNLDLNETMNQTDELCGEFLRKLEVLRLFGKDDKLIAIPSVFVERLPYLKSLSITNLFFDNKGQYAGTFERLTELNLYKTPNLMLLWKENSEQGRAFQNLEILRVSECGKLKNLVQSSMHFRNLNTLRVSKCHGLNSLATSSSVKSLVQLKQLIIYECKRIREIVTNEGEGEAGDEICFNQLKYLSLLDLPSLRSFHLGNRTIKFPSLQDLIVTGCPEMKIFSNGVLIMPKEVGLDKNEWLPERRELLPEEDVNSAIKNFWAENYGPCVQQLFTEKTDASTSETGKKNGVDNLEDDSKED